MLPSPVITYDAPFIFSLKSAYFITISIPRLSLPSQNANSAKPSPPAAPDPF